MQLERRGGVVENVSTKERRGGVIENNLTKSKSVHVAKMLKFTCDVHGLL